MSVTSVVGKAGEELAVSYVLEKGLKVEERNYRSSRGEIDIIASDNDELIFIEVKTWRGLGKASLEQALDLRKIGRIMHAAKKYMRSFEQERDMHIRFDVILIDPDTRRVDHIEHAFTENGC